MQLEVHNDVQEVLHGHMQTVVQQVVDVRDVQQAVLQDIIPLDAGLQLQDFLLRTSARHSSPTMVQVAGLREVQQTEMQDVIQLDASFQVQGQVLGALPRLSPNEQVQESSLGVA